MIQRREQDDPDELTDAQELELCDEMSAVMARQMGDSAFESEEEKAEAWRRHGLRLTKEYIAENPGRRPAFWWQEEANLEGGPTASDVPGIEGVGEFREVYGSPFHPQTAFLAAADLLSEEEVAALSDPQRAVLEELEAEENG